MIHIVLSLQRDDLSIVNLRHPRAGGAPLSLDVQSTNLSLLHFWYTHDKSWMYLSTATVDGKIMTIACVFIVELLISVTHLGYLFIIIFVIQIIRYLTVKR